MKRQLHKNRKSFRKWAMTGQRTMTDDMAFMNYLRDMSKLAKRNWWNIGRNGNQVDKST